jgi:hypothetical protein
LLRNVAAVSCARGAFAGCIFRRKLELPFAVISMIRPGRAGSDQSPASPGHETKPRDSQSGCNCEKRHLTPCVRNAENRQRQRDYCESYRDRPCSRPDIAGLAQIPINEVTKAPVSSHGRSLTGTSYVRNGWKADVSRRE